MAGIDVLILNYNYGRYLSDALESVRAQTFRDFRVILADDGSSDESAAVAEQYRDLIDELITGPHVGLGGNLARGLAACSADYVAITSADDRWLPEHLALGTAALAGVAGAALSYSLLRRIDEFGRPLAVDPTARRFEHRSGWIDPEVLLLSQFIPTQSTIFRRAMIDAVGGVDSSLMMAELDLLVRLASRYPVVFTGRVTGEYRVHATSMSKDESRMLDARMDVFDKYFGQASSPRKAMFIAETLMRSAYRDLVDDTNPTRFRDARLHVAGAIRMHPRIALRPISYAMLLASAFGSLFPGAYARMLRRSQRGLLRDGFRRLFRLSRRDRPFARVG